MFSDSSISGIMTWGYYWVMLIGFYTWTLRSNHSRKETEDYFYVKLIGSYKEKRQKVTIEWYWLVLVHSSSNLVLSGEWQQITVE